MRQLFVRDVTRAIPPVVYFHEQDPHKLMAEVDEAHRHGRLPGRPSEPEARADSYPRTARGALPRHHHRARHDRWAEPARPFGSPASTAPVSRASPSSSAWRSIVSRASSCPMNARSPPRSSRATSRLTPRTSPTPSPRSPLACARSALCLTSAAPPATTNTSTWSPCASSKRLGYSQSHLHVADFELRLERDGEYDCFLATALDVLGQPWASIKDKALAEEDFCLLLHHLFPQVTPIRPPGTGAAAPPARAPRRRMRRSAMRDMLSFRAPDATLFLVVDEVSQYVIGHADRIHCLRAFATELGSVMKGRIWLVALGQQKLEERADQNHLGWMSDRFSQKLHLAPTNIRDVIHRRLLAKTPDAQAALRDLFTKQRLDMAQYRYGAAELTPDVVQAHPLLPNDIDLLLQITSAMRQRTSRAQGDDHGIRGVLQLLGELFRSLAVHAEVGTLVTFDCVCPHRLHTALDPDLQASMARVLA